MPLIFPSCFPTPVSPLLLLLSPHAHETGCPSCFDALYRSLVLSSMSRVWSSTIIIIIIITTTQTPHHTFHHCSHASRKIANTRTLLAPRLVFFSPSSQCSTCWQRTRLQPLSSPPPFLHAAIHEYHTVSSAYHLYPGQVVCPTVLTLASFKHKSMHPVRPRCCVHSHCNRYSSPPADTPASQRQKSYTVTKSCNTRCDT